LKKKISYILFAILLIAQVISIIKLNSQQAQLNSTRGELSSLSYSLRNESDRIFSEVERQLREEASTITDASCEVGSPDIEALTVPVLFTLVPKEVGENTTVNLNFGDRVIPMDRNGTTFTTTTSFGVFDMIEEPMIEINDSGILKSTRDDRINVWSVKDAVFPAIFPQLVGRASYSNNTYTTDKHLHLDEKRFESAVTIAEMRFVIKVDDEVISDVSVPDNVFNTPWPVNEKISLTSGQVCTMTFIATDSIGFEHHFLLDCFSGGSDSQWTPMDENEIIYSADGNPVWGAE